MDADKGDVTSGRESPRAEGVSSWRASSGEYHGVGSSSMFWGVMGSLDILRSALDHIWMPVFEHRASIMHDGGMRVRHVTAPDGC